MKYIVPQKENIVKPLSKDIQGNRIYFLGGNKKSIIT